MAKYKGTINLQSMEDTMHLARCALTPPTMQHNKYKIVPTTKPKKVAVIGGGIGGMACALVLNKRGHKPVIFEKTDTLGGLFITASSMSFKAVSYTHLRGVFAARNPCAFAAESRRARRRTVAGEGRVGLQGDSQASAHKRSYGAQALRAGEEAPGGISARL